MLNQLQTTWPRHHHQRILPYAFQPVHSSDADAHAASALHIDHPSIHPTIRMHNWRVQETNAYVCHSYPLLIMISHSIKYNSPAPARAHALFRTA